MASRLVRGGGGARGARRRLARTLALLGITIALLAPAAFAFQDYTSYTLYYDNWLSPGYAKESAGFNYRTDNAGCRVGNSGLISVSYLNASGSEVTWSGIGWSNCGTSTYVIIENNGYYQSQCRHEGSIGWHARCDSYNYTP